MTPSAFRPSACVLITGASRGLGAALALEYAAAGHVLALTARDAAALAVVAARCRARGAIVHTLATDLADPRPFADWVSGLDREHPIALLIANAGVFEGRRETEIVEPLARVIPVLRTNLEGAIASIDAVIAGMIERRTGRIALVSSLAALHPLADAPAYSASKAGLAAYGAALAEAIAPMGVGVSTIYAGHIATQQAQMQVGALPLLVDAADAARLIRRGLERGANHIVFPRPLALLIGLNKLLPRWLRFRLGRSFRFHVVALGSSRTDAEKR